MLSHKSKEQLSKMLTILVNDSSQNININSTKSEQAACCYELGQNLSNKLIYYGLEQQALNIEQEEILRSELPFVPMPEGPYKSVFCIWKNIIILLLGVIFGIFVVEGLGLKGAWIIIGAGLGASLGSLLKTFVENISNKGSEFVIFGKSLSFKSLRRRFKILLIAIILLLFVRDFFQQNAFLQIWLESLSSFLLEGSTVALWSNMYNVVIILIIFSLCLRQKIELDVAEFKNRLLAASLAWWVVAMRFRGMVIDTQASKVEEEPAIFNKIIKDIYLFANELPQDQQKWLLEHLNLLNIKISRPQGQLIWSDDLELEYEVIGYLKEGDACYVDAPAMWKDEKLISKGTMRKIR